ncbi:CocE/NonD family hydrolase [Phaeobacter sp. C3_T13_0]|uniref:CocE/NonD family hydrolase n=1 Tax=Phaeobacter cretensis TaxID=3342641 RepID=UPI0039BCA2FE
MPMEITVIEHLWIPLPDGRRLAARMWRPVAEGRYPAILEYLPYRKRDGTAPRDATTHPVFAAEGYVCLRVDIAGTGDSEGIFDDEYSEQELSDGEAVLAWLEGQTCCNGNIGMIGISWGGFNGLQLAARQPEALKAVVSVASTVDRYADDIHFMGGCLLSDNANWASQMFAYQTRPLDPKLRPDWREAWVERIETLPFMAADWLGHGQRDDFWKHGSVCEDWSAMEAPVLAITGWADAYLNAPPAIVENMQAPAKALIGPWEHRYAHISKLGTHDFHGEVLRWFDRWLKGENSGAEALPDYRTYMQEHFVPTKENKPRQGRWIAEAQWPSPNVRAVTHQLGQDGCLQNTPATGEVVVSNPATLGAAGGYFCAGMRIDNELPGDQSGDDALSACFDSAPLEAPLEILGRAKVRLAFSVDRPVAQVVARLCDVAPDGVSQRITYRGRNLCHDDNHEIARQLVPGQRYEVEFDLNECAHHLRQGHVLRLALSTSYWPIVWPSPEPVALTLHLDACALILPERTVPVEADAQAPDVARKYPVYAAAVTRAASGTSNTYEEDDGTLVLETFDDYGSAIDPVHGMEVGSHVAMRYSVHPDDPAGATFSSQWQFTFARGDWRVQVDTDNLMRGDTQDFHLWRKVVASEGTYNHEVCVKEWSQTLPRDCL